MKRHAWGLCLMLALASCKGDEGGGGDNNDAGTPPVDPNKDSPFQRLTLDEAGTDLQPLSLAVGPGDTVGVAYFFRVSDAQYEIRYVQVGTGGRVSQPETVATVKMVYGLSLAFDSNGRPAVAYLGGEEDKTAAFWFQNDQEVAFRNASGQWVKKVAVKESGEARGVSDVSNSGKIVGLNPSLVFNGTQAIVAYRDVHQGQFDRQDYDASDLEVAIGGPDTWTHAVVAESGDNKRAYGGHIDMVMADGQPALVHDQVSGSAEGTGANVLFQRRNANGTWTKDLQVQAVSNTQRGASLAWDPVLGFGIAVVERSANRLTFVSCAGTSPTRCTAAGDWVSPDPVYASGTGGWYPSLAIDPSRHEPSIAFYICSNASGVNEGSCNPNDDELRVTTRIEGNWREALVDAEGGWSPKMAYLSTGQRVIAYRLGNGVLKLAVDR
ncbi:hypothetical protein [Stigmatella aurantiaca]|uniref:Conserved uncharacterized protein n=1 Tax=Stigmatella aurantiaca (strain DW4/3-1) TaxID=378806 RepID=Q097G6_STIAD|nr:hypothetical protein [Stigmatella aurantiaca]ADO69867.1 conserved uncharacterized protein [Stigmatella aurantiaca DW4/3-1]EAU67898.1 hypothetical protein STIAU_2294 [Stigmatella aurantiaca DW4/3-1]